MRTPYNPVYYLDEVNAWTTLGYAVVIQSVRGKYGSRGVFQPYMNELRDGLALVSWLNQQAWAANGIVAYGGSYAAHCALMLHTHGPSTVLGTVCMVPAIGFGDYFRDNRVFFLASAVRWSMENCQTEMHERDAFLKHVRGDPDLIDSKTVVNSCRKLFGKWPDKKFALEESNKREDIILSMRFICRPILHIGGWFDGFFENTWRLATCQSLNSSMIIGPWTHSLHAPSFIDIPENWNAVPFSLVSKWVNSLTGKNCKTVHMKKLLGIGENQPSTVPNLKQKRKEKLLYFKSNGICSFSSEDVNNSLNIQAKKMPPLSSNSKTRFKRDQRHLLFIFSPHGKRIIVCGRISFYLVYRAMREDCMVLVKIYLSRAGKVLSIVNEGSMLLRGRHSSGWITSVLRLPSVRIQIELTDKLVIEIATADHPEYYCLSASVPSKSYERVSGSDIVISVDSSDSTRALLPIE